MKIMRIVIGSVSLAAAGLLWFWVAVIGPAMVSFAGGETRKNAFGLVIIGAIFLLSLVLFYIGIRTLASYKKG
jgi:hypothetical protein